jgi:enoyl-CoA hydratase/carnithine racemase
MRLLNGLAGGALVALQRGPPRAVAAIKRAVCVGADRDLESGLYVERTELTQLMCSEDARSVLTAHNQAVARDPMTARSEFLKDIACRPQTAVE